MNQHVGSAHKCTELEAYLVDLNGYLILRNALSPEELAACNATLAVAVEKRSGQTPVDGVPGAIECHLKAA